MLRAKCRHVGKHEIPFFDELEQLVIVQALSNLGSWTLTQYVPNRKAVGWGGESLPGMPAHHYDLFSDRL